MSFSNVKKDYIKDVLNCHNADLLFLQETWLLEDREHLLGQIDDNYMYTAQSGMDHTEEILQGRPYGGVAIMLGEITFTLY